MYCFYYYKCKLNNSMLSVKNMVANYDYVSIVKWKIINNFTFLPFKMSKTWICYCYGDVEDKTKEEICYYVDFGTNFLFLIIEILS